MGWLVISALCNIGLGFYLGVRLAQPAAVTVSVLAIPEVKAPQTPLPNEMPPNETQPDVSQPDENQAKAEIHSTQKKPKTSNAAAAATTEPAKQNNAALSERCTDIRQDIRKLYERIRYSFTANDKQLARMIAAESQNRVPLWQKLLEEKMAAAGDPTGTGGAAFELCLAQTETLQTNLALIDWSEPTDSILKKLEREIEAVKHLLPTQC